MRPLRNKNLGFLLVLIFALSFSHLALADARDDFKDVLEARQRAVVDAYDKLDTRVKGMNSADPKKDHAEDLLDTAEDATDAFKGLDAGNNVQPESGDGPFSPKNDFEVAEKAAFTAINDVNRFIFSPARPGEGEGTVPKGDLMKDFIPQAIRLLFRFTSVAILIAIVVSGVMLATAMDNEEKATKAKHMLTFSLVGFVFVALAFAIVKAVTDIDFFGFV